MTSYSELVAEILTESNGAPEIIIERVLRNTAIDFLNDTELWQARVSFPSVESQAEYSLTVDPGQTILKLTYCAFDGKELLQTVPHRQFGEHGRPEFYFLRDDKVHLRPNTVPDGKNIEVEVIYRPNRVSVAIPTAIADKWFEVIQYGALSRLLMMAATPWYNPQRAQLYTLQYEDGKLEAIREGKRLNHSRIVTTRFSW
jgi:hypothetical protein